MTARFLIGQAGQAAQRLPYLLALPTRVGPHTPLWVSVHGVTRQPLSHAQAFYRPAQAAGAALLVPFFSAERHRRYQRLAHPVSGRRSDLALLKTVRHVRRLCGLSASPFHLFGYSAGAQFAHRFAMAHPHQVAALALGAAGWYTWPDHTQPYPMGWAGMAQALQLPALDHNAFLSLPQAVWVGEHDDRPDHAMRSSPALDAWQGRDRLERARRWALAVDSARSLALPPGRAPAPVPMHTVRRAGHDFSACARRGRLAWQVAEFFAQHPVPAARSGVLGTLSDQAAVTAGNACATDLEKTLMTV